MQGLVQGGHPAFGMQMLPHLQTCVGLKQILGDGCGPWGPLSMRTLKGPDRHSPASSLPLEPVRQAPRQENAGRFYLWGMRKTTSECVLGRLQWTELPIVHAQYFLLHRPGHRKHSEIRTGDASSLGEANSPSDRSRQAALLGSRLGQKQDSPGRGRAVGTGDARFQSGQLQEHEDRSAADKEAQRPGQQVPQ